MNKNQLIALLITLAVLFSAVDSHAQHRHPLPMAADSIPVRESRALQQHLHLTDAQTAQVARAMKMYQVNKSNFQKLKLDTAAVRHGKEQMLQKYRNEIKAILTPDQYVSYIALLEQRRKVFHQQAAAQGITVKELEAPQPKVNLHP